MSWHGARAKVAARRGAVNGLQEWAQEVFDGSQKEVPVAPVKGGYLRDSGKVDVDSIGLQAAVSYSGPPTSSDGRSAGTDVAVMVHEDLSASHSTGKAKYLESPLNASREIGQAIVAREIKKAL